jgi:menaquinone-dependent protoporphyrinogen IX oxidase
MKKQMRFDIKRFIDDAGGAREVAKMTGKMRTRPYRWIEQGHMNTILIAAIKQARPDLKVDDYFIND